MDKADGENGRFSVRAGTEKTSLAGYSIPDMVNTIKEFPDLGNFPA
jgi:hypothetical protein